MYTSFFDVFSIGIGPSSSHTMGPMRAATRFVDELADRQLLERTSRVQVVLYGSLALTGEGHGTPRAVVYGLMGLDAETMDPGLDLLEKVNWEGKVTLAGGRRIEFHLQRDIVLDKETSLKEHANGMRMGAYDESGASLWESVYFSIGGGAVRRQDEMETASAAAPRVPLPFDSCADLMHICQREGMTIADVVMHNEAFLRPRDAIYRRLRLIVETMSQGIEHGMAASGVLPGGLNLARRAPQIYHRLEEKFLQNEVDSLMMIDWINLWAFAVAEENAAGGRVVTAPTMGSAGIMPAVLRYYERFGAKESSLSREAGQEAFLLTASAICSLYRANASISGAEVGCQGEVGVACSMAAAGLTAAMGGNLAQVENAAEIAMEHNLGLTCDPVCGLVQVPCIERNAIGAVKAVNAARLAMRGDGSHYVSLDSVIAAMDETGRNLSSAYKETSLAGLARHVLTC